MSSTATRQPRWPSPRDRRRRAGALVLALATVGLAGCVGIPTSSPIGTGDVVVDEPGQAIQLADDPVQGAGPEEIVNGFLLAAAAGFYDEFAVARKYLTGGAAGTWDPRAGVTVYPRAGGDPTRDVREDDTVLVTFPVEATVDSAGRYTEVAPGSVESAVFEMEQDADGQWRIGELPDGVLMSAPSFESLFRPASVYFATQDVDPGTRQLVPELRHFPSGDVATAAVEALLQGPSPWLRDAVVSGAPEGARLSTAAVTVSGDRVASVDLSAESRSGTADRNLLQAQLEATLEQRRPGTLVTDVEVTVAGLPWEATDVPDLDRDVAPDAGPYVLTDEGLALLEGSELVPVDAADLAGLDARRAAVSLDGSIRVVLTADSRLLLLPPDAAPPEELLAGESLVAPSIDRFGWVWTGEAASAGGLQVVSASGQVERVPADWLEGRTVRSLRVSRDGARIAVVSSSATGGDVHVDVAAVVRDEESGVPQYVGGEEQLQVGAVLVDASEVAWVDEVTLAVLGVSGSLNEPAVHLVPLGGRTSVLALRDATVGLAAGRGTTALFLVDADGALISRQSGSWVTLTDGVREVVFPG